MAKSQNIKGDNFFSGPGQKVPWKSRHTKRYYYLWLERQNKTSEKILLCCLYGLYCCCCCCCCCCCRDLTGKETIWNSDNTEIERWRDENMCSWYVLYFVWLELTFGLPAVCTAAAGFIATTQGIHSWPRDSQQQQQQKHGTVNSIQRNQ